MLQWRFYDRADELDGQYKTKIIKAAPWGFRCSGGFPVYLVFGIILVYMIYFFLCVRPRQRRRIFYTRKYYRGKWQILVVGAGISLGIICWLTLSPSEQEKLEIGRFLGTVWADPGNVTPSLDNLRIKGSESGDKPVYAFLHPDSLLNNEEGRKSPKTRPSCKPRPPKKPRGQGKARWANIRISFFLLWSDTYQVAEKITYRGHILTF